MHIEDKYSIIDQLGAGSSGNVMRITKNGEKEIEYALKVIYLNGKTDERLERENFVAELDALKNLNHPNISCIYDAGFDEERNALFLVAELINGADLFKATEAMDFSQKEDLFVQALRALNYLHEQGVSHLDIKPQNILVTKDSALKLIDFGLANFYDRHAGTTESPVYAGTAAYMAPEILRGEKPDSRADLYSLGISFFKVFARKLPFMAITADEAREAHLNETPSTLSGYSNTLPVYLDKIFEKLLQKTPADRYQKAADVIRDLSLLSGKNFEVETSSTVLSYIPEKGTLVCRETEIQMIEKIFKERILSHKHDAPNGFVVCGPEGSGKTRLLEEVRHLAQKNMVNVMSLETFDTTPVNEIKTPVVVLGDQKIFDDTALHFAKVLFAKKPLLMVITSLTLPQNTEDTVIALNNFTREQTGIYLQKASGIEPLPKKIIETVFSHTQGNPRLVAEYTTRLFEEGFLRDTFGKWSEDIVEDIGLNLGEGNLTNSIKTRLKKNIEEHAFTSSQWNILNVLALTGKPTLVDLIELSQPSSIHDDLATLVASHIIAIEGANYHFTNPLYAEVIVEMMDPSDAESRSDKIADYLEKQGAEKELVLQHRGNGKSPEAPLKLFELSQIKRTQFLNTEAINILEILVHKNNVDPSLMEKATLELSGLYLETGLFGKAREVLKKISMGPQAWELMGAAYYLEGNHKEALPCYEKGLQQATGNLAWMSLVFKSRMARLQYDTGHTDKAQQLMQEYWDSWNELKDEGIKIKAIRNDIDFIYTINGELDKAMQVLDAYLTLLSDKQDSPLYLPTLYNLGLLKRKAGKKSESRAILGKCLDRLKHKKIYHWLYSVYNELGNLEEDCGDWKKALDYFMHTFELVRKTSLKTTHMYGVCFNIARMHLKLNDLETAYKYFNFVHMSLSKVTGHELQKYLALLGLANVCRLQENFEKASQHLHEAFTLLHQSPSVSVYSQYYWQEKADLERKTNNVKNLKIAFNELEKLKNKTGFNLEDYKSWETESL